MGNTPLRAMRIAEDIWQAAQKRAVAEGTNVTAVVVAFLKRYGAKAPEKSEVTETPNARPSSGVSG